MTETTDERPFYEQAQASRVSHPPASRLPVYLICGAAFGAGLIAFFIGGLPDGVRTGDFGRSIAYMLGYKLGGQLVYAAVIGGAATAFLSVTDGRKFRQRTAGEDFLWPFLSAVAGGLTVIAVIVALGAPAMAANAQARPVIAAHNAAMAEAGRNFDRDILAVGNGQDFMTPKNLASDPGYRRTLARIDRLRGVVADHRQREADLRADSRRKLAAAVNNPRQRSRLLAEYDANIARQSPLLARYWTLQEDAVDNLSQMVAILRTSPSTWRDGMLYFNRTSDLRRFEAVQADNNSKGAELESVRQQLKALQPPA